MKNDSIDDFILTHHKQYDMAEITYQMILSTIQTIALIVGIIYYLTIMRNQQKTRNLALQAQENALQTRQSQLFMNVYNQSYSNPEFLRAIRHVQMIAPQINSIEDYLRKMDFMNPDAEDLAEIAIQASIKCRSLGFEPRVAMLSFSSFGSVDHPNTIKVRRATEMVKARFPDLEIDGDNGAGFENSVTVIATEGDDTIAVSSGQVAVSGRLAVNLADSEPDTLPDACRIRVTWQSSDIDGEVTRSLVQLRGPDLLAQQDWSSGWVDYGSDTTMWWNVGDTDPERMELPALPKLLEDKVREIPGLITLIKINKGARYARMVEILDRIEIVEYRFRQAQKAA